LKGRKLIAIYFLLFLLLLSGCSGENKSSSSDKSSSKADSKTEIMNDTKGTADAISEKSGTGINPAVENKEVSTERMVIHNAELQLKVKNLEAKHMKLEDKVKQYGGYIVESNVYSETEGYLNGLIVARIPEKNFQKFMDDAEATALKVMERTVKGKDITEEYVDLQSRLKSKRTVESRLLDFMGKAEKTEDLLKISSDLATVQQEIETIIGRMKFLDNQVAYATVTINTSEKKVIVPAIDKEDLHTWKKTTQQFAGSINFLMAALSAVIVFTIGNLPVIVILFAIAWGVYIVIKRRKKREEQI
jgi:uncharacterized membrane protein